MVCNNYLPFCWLPFHFVDYFICCAENFHFEIVCLFSIFVSSVFHVISKRIIAKTSDKNFALILSSRSFRVSSLRFKLWVNFCELCELLEIQFYFSACTCLVFQTIFVEKTILFLLSVLGYLVNYSIQFSCSAMSDSLWPHEPQCTRPPCPSPTPGVYPNSCPLSWWCHLTISSSVVPFFSCLQSFPILGSFQMSQLFASGDQSTEVSASTSVLPMNTQDRSPLGWIGWIFL